MNEQRSFKKRLAALLLCAVMIVSSLPVGVFAEEIQNLLDNDPASSQSVDTEPASSPAVEPTAEPTEAPTAEPTTEPTAEPTAEPTEAPTAEPTTEPTAEPEVVAVTGLTLDAATLEVSVGAEPVQLTASVLPEDAADKTVIWTSSEPGVAAVDENGVVTFGYMGEAVITASCGDVTATCAVTVGEGEIAVYEYTGPAYVDALIFASDIHSGPSAAKSIMAGVAKSGLTYSSATFIGDTYSDKAGTAATDVTPYIQDGLSNKSVQVMYSWGDHDYQAKDIADYTGLLYGDQNTNYYIYAISMSAMTDMGDSKTGRASTYSEELLNAFTSDVGKMDHTKPLFIATHMPLHTRRGDNDYAYNWYQVIEAAAQKMDVVVFWAHNHTGDTGQNYDSTCYFMEPGTQIEIQGASKTQTLNFTYANAGYINPPNGSGRKNVATSVTIFDDSMEFVVYDANGEYSSDTFATGGTVKRLYSNSNTLESIAISGTTVYTVGGNGLDLTVTATYDDGTTADVTADATFTPAELTASGTYTVTASYGGMTDTIDVKVNLYKEVLSENGEYLLIAVEAFSQGATALEVVWDDDADAILCEKGLYTDYVVYDLALTNPGETTRYAMTMVDNMDTTNLAVYHVADDGTLTLVPHTLENDCVVFTTALTGTFAYGAVAVPEGYTLSSITLENIPTDLFVGGSLDIYDAVITATYTKEGAEDYTRQLTVYDWDETNWSGYDVNAAGAQTAVFTYEDVTAELPIYIWGEEFTVNDVTVRVGEGEYGVTAATVVPSENANVASAIQSVITGDNYVAYDITLTYSEGYEANDADKTVTLPIPEGVTNPVVYYVSDSGKSVVDMKAEVTEDGEHVTFTTTHFSTYVVGENTSITVPENVTAAGSSTVTTTTQKTVYKLVSSLTAGEEYLIVSRNTAGSGYGLAGSTTGQSVTVKAADDVSSVVYIDEKGSALEWTASSGWAFTSGSYDLGYSNGLSFSTEDEWSFDSNRLYQSVRSGRNTYTYYLRCDNGTWSASTSSSNVYFYQKTEVDVETTTTISGTYSIDGADETVSAVKGATVDLSSILTFTPESGTATTEDVSAAAAYEIVTVDADGKTVDGDPLDVISGISGNVVTLSGKTGKALVKVTYTASFGVVTDYITIEAAAPDHYGINLHKAELTEVTVTASTFDNGVYYTFNSTTNTYEIAENYVEGTTTYYTAFTEATDVTKANFGSGVYYTYDSDTKTYSVANTYAPDTTYYTYAMQPGAEITAPLALKGIEAGDTYTVWAVVKAYTSADDTEGTDIGTLGNKLSWKVSDESIATIDPATGLITFTGNNYGTFDVTVAYEGADGKVITDTITISVTDSLYVVPGDGTNDFPEYPNEGSVRFDKTATAVGNYSETGIAKVELSMTGVPYSAGNAIDALLVLDMSTSMKTSVGTDVTRYDVTADATKAFIKTIVQNADGTYNNNTVCVHYFNGTTAYTDKITSGFITIKSDAELQAVYDKIDALIKEPPSTSGTDYSTSMKAAYDAIIARDKVSDNTQALVFMSDGGPTYYTYVNGDSYGTVSNDASTIVSWFDTDDNDTTNNETDDTATPNTSFKNEYYSTLLKNAGYPVYTVGLGLAENSTGPKAFTELTSGAHEAITSYILSSMATNSNYFYNVADSDAVANMGNIFSGIAASIKEAAKDVVVEDKIGSNYTMNFGLPGYGTGNALKADALDGLTKFYIQVVEYTLDSTTHERTDTYTVKENFTFNLDGALASHTVDGAACSDSDCTHVTTNTSGVITAIDGTYFDYKSDSTGEYLTWTADKLTANELALQYFAYLDNSSGVAEGDQVDPGTYYTNEYATLTYTNVNDRQVQQKFPVPQMTWYGAQVSYTFYLVNDDGNPVNRAGRVVPFAEAVYVTDVYTEAVTWNDLEQSAGLEAERLANDLVPEVYALYDDDASYNIHVYADEKGVNLNNHFVIGGDATDDYNKTNNSWTNAKTTYVFNNKSDGTKYNTVGAYIANDGSDTTTTNTYLCKGEGTISGVAWSVVTLTGDSDLVNGVYYYDVDGVKTRALTYTENTTYYQLTSAKYDKVDGETHWTPGDKDSTTGGTVIGNHVYYVDEKGEVYTIVQKSNGTEVHAGFDFANTTVAFAVVWKPQLAPDTVVIDYGLDVVIDVIKNDNMAAGVNGVMLSAPDVATDGTYTTAVGAKSVTSADGIWTASEESMTSVRFHLNNMTLSAPAVFYYEAGVNYYTYDESGKATLNAPNMYSSVTVIPATTIYYEDDFLKLSSFTKTDNVWGEDETSEWVAEGTTVSKTQEQDRPGESKISAALDADNNYGYDKAYETMSKHSLGSGAKVTVNANRYATAEFTFYGTGFDLISLTSNTTGTITVLVKDAEGNKVRNTVVDTYYGMEVNGKLSANDPGTIYQVPVIKIFGLDYGKYTVKVTAAYNSIFDHNSEGSYDLYLDAVRIYDPAGTTYDEFDEKGNQTATGNIDSVIQNAYIADGEGWPTYEELRNNIIEAGKFVHDGTSYTAYKQVAIDAFEDGVTYFTKNEDGIYSEVIDKYSSEVAYYVVDTCYGFVFIDCNDNTSVLADYVNYGPNNEVYLANNQAIAFNVDTSNGVVADVQLGIKSATGSTVTYEINGDSYTTSSATDLYYSILQYAKAGTVTIKNVSGGILSLTNIKVTHTENPNATSATSLLWMDGESVGIALMSLRRTAATPEPTAEPTATPTAEPTAAPTAEPTAVPTAEPTAAPTAEPTAAPTAEPTAAPTAAPTAVPTAVPTAAPTAVPIAAPTAEPTAVPTAVPAVPDATVPSGGNTSSGGSTTAQPESTPTAVPDIPADETVPEPTAEPTAVPTAEPEQQPTVEEEPTVWQKIVNWFVSLWSTIVGWFL